MEKIEYNLDSAQPAHEIKEEVKEKEREELKEEDKV